MKSVFILIGACFFSFSAMAGDDAMVYHPAKYCAKMKDGKLVVMHEGRQLAYEATLTNGTKIKTDGTIIKKDGSTVMLKNGECIDKEGKIMEEGTSK